MKPLWALLVRQQRAMKTLTIHFMDWAVVRTDNTGLINETGLVSWRKRRGYKSATGDGIQSKATGLVSCCWYCWWGKSCWGLQGKLTWKLVMQQQLLHETMSGWYGWNIYDARYLISICITVWKENVCRVDAPQQKTPLEEAESGFLLLFFGFFVSNENESVQFLKIFFLHTNCQKLAACNFLNYL